MDGKPLFLRGKGRGHGRGAPINNQNVSSNSIKGAAALPSAWNKGNRFKDEKSAKDRFEEASSRLQKSVQHHLQDLDNKEDSSEEEEDIGDNVLETIFKTYSTNYDSGNSGDVNKAQEYLLHSFRSGSSACLICIESVKREDGIWNCKGCFCMFHMQCIQKWVREGAYQNMYKSGDETQQNDVPWLCPKCRHEYKQNECPTRYYCFCEKVRDPKFDPWLVPHSCGQTCGQQLKPDCGHSCLLLCHPGPCPPCPKMVKAKCHCGRQAPQTRRCSARTWSCSKPCGQKLSCGQHNCQQVCHPGTCAPCPKTSNQKCLCGKKTSSRPCASPEWPCDQPCGRPLCCGHHRCEIVCHKDTCGDCPRSGIRKCPCGKSEFQLPCTEDIPTCGDTCGKLLTCGVHSCTQRCHVGACGPCLQVLQKRCRCGQRQKEVPCSKEYLCDLKCSNMRDCRKHQCKRKCCDGNCPTCEQVCGKNLGCRNHKCASRCHRGPCYPCPLTVNISCFCKASSITVPCGREKVTKPPRCNKKCKIPPNCHHPSREPHRCHFGECPPCRQTCLLPLSNCGHTCPTKCHDAVKIKVQDKTPRIGPWEGRPTMTIQTVHKDCPPCQVPMPVQCYGKHETIKVPCSEVGPYSCKRLCGRRLTCGNHTCSHECHIVQNASNDDMAGETCDKCEHHCQKARPQGCKHPCLLPCHPKHCPPCSHMIRMRCHCQTVVKHVGCKEWTTADTNKQDLLKSCGGQCCKSLPCGHQCGTVCHPGECPPADKCEKKVNIRCPCRRRKKEVICRDIKSGKEKLECDNICQKGIAEKKKLEEEAQKARKEEEQKKHQAELEEYERLMKGRKKKPRKQHEQPVEPSFWEKQKRIIIVFVSLTVVFLGVFVYLIKT